MSRPSGCSVSYHYVSRSNASTLVPPVIVVSSCIIERNRAADEERSREELNCYLIYSSQCGCFCIFSPVLSELLLTPLMVVTLVEFIEFLFNVNNFVGPICFVMRVEFSFV